MPVMFLRDPLGCLIVAGDVGDGLKLAIMAAPCHLRPPALKLRESTARTLQQLLGGPRRITQISGTGFGGAGYVAAKQRCEALRRLGLAELRDRQWSITAAGRAWLASQGAPS